MFTVKLQKYKQLRCVLCTFIFYKHLEMAKMQKDTIQFENLSFTKYVRYSSQISFPSIYDLIDYFWVITIFISVLGMLVLMFKCSSNFLMSLKLPIFITSIDQLESLRKCLYLYHRFLHV